jgi:hypothetical protein|tara:strand:+ start:129 stop:737 length:609 start_codon:yes stop_codon:yes gene_type:complete
MPNKTTKDSLGRDAAWAKWEKGYMDRTHKMKGTKFEKPITPEENRREMEMERGEFMYDKAKGQIRLRKTDDAERPLEMRSPLDHKPFTGRAHIHNKNSVSYEGDNTFEKNKKAGGKVVPAGKAYKSRDEYMKDSTRNEPHKAEKKSPLQMVGVQSPLNKISGPCKTAAKKKFKVWPSAYASGWGVRCTKAGGPSKYGGGSKK